MERSACAECGQTMPLREPGTGKKRGTGSLFPVESAERVVQRSERRQVTVLFLDISGFTAMSEKLDPEVVIVILNEFFDVLSEPIYRFGGVVDKYMGDAIMALFGAPVAHEDDPERAVRAALEMQAAAKEFSDRLFQEIGVVLQVRIGINTGPVVAGVVGGRQKRDYTVMGDSVNLAQRMEANARPGTILVAEETYRQTSRAFDFVALEPITVKGKRDAIAVFEVSGLKADQGQSPASRVMVGREAELRQLRASFEESLAGKPQIVYLTGEAGIGKSQLFSEFVCGLDPVLGADVQRVRAISYEQGTPFALVGEFIRRWLGLRDKDLGAVSLESLKIWAGTVPFLPPEMREQLPVAITYLLGLDTENAAFEQLSPQQRRVMAFLAFNTALLYIAQARPLILDFEDLHWADEASVEWLQSLMDLLASKQFASSRIMILCMARPVPENPLPQMQPRIAARSLELLPLSEAEAWSLIASVLDSQPEAWSEQASRLLSQVHGRAEGNPLFLTELVRSLVDSGALARDEQGRWQVAATAEPSLPSTVSGVISARFDRLPDHLREVLQVASVVGRGFRTGHISKVGGFFQVERALSELLKAEFVRARPSGEYLFYLALTHEVVYNSLLLSTRRDLHRRVGEMLEKEFGDRSEETPQVLARHYQLGEVPEKALYYLYLSGKQAQNKFANQEALHCFTQCLEILEKGGDLLEEPSRDQVLLSLAEILANAGQHEQALQHLETALALQSEPQKRAETMRRLGNVLNLQGKYADALQSYDQGLEMLLAAPDTLTEARILQDKALSFFRQGQYVEVVTLCEKSLQALDGSEHLKEVAMAESVLGLVCYRQNRLTEAEAYHRNALSKREAVEDLFGVASSLNNLGVLYREVGDWTKAGDHYLRSLQIYQRIWDVSRQIFPLINLSDLMRNQGELDMARKYYKQVQELSEQIQDAFGRAYAALGLGMVLLDEGDSAAAAGQLEEGLALLQAINAREVLPEAYIALARSYLSRDELVGAHETVLKALELARENKSSQHVGMALGVEAMLKLKGGELASAQATIQEAVKELRDGGSLIDLARGLAIEAVVLEASGSRDEAGTRREEAEGLFRKLGASLDLRRLQGAAREA